MEFYYISVHQDTPECSTPQFYCDGCDRSFHHRPEGMAMLGQCMDCWKEEQMQDLWAEFAKE